MLQGCRIISYDSHELLRKYSCICYNKYEWNEVGKTVRENDDMYLIFFSMDTKLTLTALVN